MTDARRSPDTSGPAPRRCARNRKGQSLLEACLGIFLICLVFAGLFQISQLFASREVLYHAANRGTRARAVGFREWMVKKAARVAAIPNSGPMLVPGFVNDNPALQDAVLNLAPGALWTFALQAVPLSQQVVLEKALIPYYLGAVNEWQAAHILDYEGWDSVAVSVPDFIGPPDLGQVIHATVSQNVELWVPLHGAFYDGDFVPMKGESYIENHYPLYMHQEAP